MAGRPAQPVDREVVDSAFLFMGDSTVMSANPFLGVMLHAAGGLAAGSFYLPFKKVRVWSWESYSVDKGLD